MKKKKRASRGRAKPFFYFRLALVAIIVFFVVQFGFEIIAKPRVLGTSTRYDQQKLLTLINQERLNYGLGPLSPNTQLNQAASLKGENMFQENYWAHNSQSGKDPWYFIEQAGYDYQSAGENLARDFASEEAMLTAWMNSPSHRENILNGRYLEAGFAVLEGKIDNEEVFLVVSMFGTPSKASVLGARQVLSDIYAGEVDENRTAISTNDEENISTDEAIFTSSNVIEGASTPPNTTSYQVIKIIFALAVLILIVFLVYEVLFFRKEKMRQFAANNLSHLMLFCMVLFLIIISISGFLN